MWVIPPRPSRDSLCLSLISNSERSLIYDSAQDIRSSTCLRLAHIFKKVTILPYFLYFRLEKHILIIDLQHSTTCRVPLIILGVDGYAFQTYQELGHHLDDVLFALPLQPVFPTASFPNFYSISTVCHVFISIQFSQNSKYKAFLRDKVLFRS